MQELRFNSLLVKWTYRRVGEGLAALHDMIALRNPSPQEVFIQILKEKPKWSGEWDATVYCRDRGIRFGIVDEASILLSFGTWIREAP